MTAPRSVGPTVASQAVLAPLTDAAIFLVATVRPGGEQAVRDLLEDLSGLQRTVGFRLPAAQLSCVTGIGSDLWDRLFAGPRPAELHRFRAWKGPKHSAPSTPGDLLFHIRAGQMDVCFELAAKIGERLRGAGDIVDETHGFKYFDERDLLGFVDGTENPSGAKAMAAVVIGDEDEAFSGGSYVMVQKYIHDLEAWNALKVEDQEAAIGRRKLDNVEIPDEDKAPNSHVKLNVIEDEDGNEFKILRDNMPFGSVKEGEFGTYYIAYAATPDVPELMLRRMFLGEPYGTYDRILDFSTALTGSLFYVPTVDFLDDLPPSAQQPGQVGQGVEP
ncbi:Dyp-type peroxidase [Actinoplanes sp. TRM 88003]|uniref:Dyp-type peroxidase n=1 Tax=Paractinoplanes aksuensis TaxID=2939490 RepID=A0ABT1DRP5_9ACTN|nr:Dyp-type peroxidase [Actinoplanes aksuensis]MCO8273497.1 Dyp-type peroxidase [Actinoplanes aksuensis]